MADEMVLAAQRFINTTYENVPGIPPVEEDGKTGWPTMYALTRCLQYELGISALSDSFGPTTLSTLQSRWPSITAATAPSANVVRIIQSGLYCKGYDGGEIDGLYNERVSASVEKLKSDAGVAAAFPGDAMVPKLFKSLLNMDAYVVVTDGTETIRSIQQWMNARYVNRANFFVIPCDGHFSRDVQKALMLAIQFELGLSDSAATGTFGPTTQAGLKANTLSVGSAGTWVQLFSAAMIFNQRSGTTFTSAFDAALSSRVTEFQNFVELPATGKGDFPTWASLLVSTGDTTRRGTALDCVTEITADRADALKAAGYTTVGRYLSNVPNTSLNKMIQPGELSVLAAKGLHVFPIYQTFGGSAGYFTYDQGAADGFSAIEWARYHGFRPGTRIYFAVDFDALDSDVTSNIIPHFTGIKDTLDEHSAYVTGIYGPRNVCSRVGGAGLTSASFVSDMSTGFSGNLGYPMPQDWAFDQISTISVGSGSGAIEIDNDIASGRDAAQSAFDAGSLPANLDVDFDMSLKGALLTDIQTYLTGIGVPETGGSDIFDSDNATLGFNSTTDSFEATMSWDGIITSVARELRMRKALIQCPILWEIRKYNLLDPPADAAVRDHYDGTGVSSKDDSSTGLAQIFARTAINARNFAVQQGIINGPLLDTGDPADVWSVWQKLQEGTYTVNTVGYVHIWDADDITVPRPGLDPVSDDYVSEVLARFNGTGPDADEYGQQLLGLYKVFEKYEAPLRNS